MSNDKKSEDRSQRINRRTVLKGAAVGSAIGLVGIPSISGSALATNPCSDTVVDLIAGQNEVIGTVTVTNDDDEITVTYSLAGDWYMTESHLHIASDCGDIPQTGSGNPKVGRFEFSDHYDPATQEDTYVASLDAQGFEPGDLVCIAAHAAVFEDEDDDGVYDAGEREETAWGDGTRFTERGNWAMHLEYEICVTDTGWFLRGPDDFASWNDATAFRVNSSRTDFMLDVRPNCNENEETERLSKSYGISMLEWQDDCYEQVGTTRLWSYPDGEDLEIGGIYEIIDFESCPAITRRSSPDFDEKTDRVTFAQLDNAMQCNG